MLILKQSPLVSSNYALRWLEFVPIELSTAGRLKPQMFVGKTRASSGPNQAKSIVVSATQLYERGGLQIAKLHPTLLPDQSKH